MPYKVTFRGVAIECSTPAEAVAIAKQLAGVANDGAELVIQEGSSSETDGRLTKSRYKEFVGYLDSGKKQLLQLLIENPHGKTDESLRKALGLDDNKALGGMMSGLSKLARKTGLSIDDILSSRWVKVGDEDMKEYRAAAAFGRMASELGGLK